MLRFLVPLILLPWLMSCEKLHNRLNLLVLDCGEEARDRGGSWIKILDPQGKELPETEQLDARVLEINAEGSLPQALPVSRKHCVSTGQATSLVVRSLAQDRSWSVLISDAQPWLPIVKLQDQSQQRLRLRCPDPWINDGRFKLPLEITPGTQLEALALAPRLVSSDGRESPQSFALQNAAVILSWPQVWPDGPGQLSLRQRNFLQNPRSSLAESEESCAVIIDRQKPVLQLTPDPGATRSLEVQPGSLLRLHMADTHPASLQWCLKKSDEALCDNEENWQTAKGEVSLPMPVQGRWILQARGYDAAGNASEPLQQMIDVVQGDVIRTIASRVDQALAEKANNSWQSALTLLRALVDYRRLVLPTEQDKVKNKLVDGILSATGAMHERQRVTLPGTPRRVWSLGPAPESPWLALTSTQASLWSGEGRPITQIPVGDALAADWSPSQQALVLSTADELVVLRLKELKFLPPLSLRWADHSIFGAPGAVKWIPGGNSLAVAIRGDLPAVLNYDDNGLRIVQRLDLKDTVQLAMAPDGWHVAGSSTEAVNVWALEGGSWKTVASEEQVAEDLQFTPATDVIPSRLLIQLSDGRLRSWSPKILWKDLDEGVLGEKPSEGYDVAEPASLQPWLDGTAGLMERGGRLYHWSNLPEKKLQAIPLTDFDWDRLRSWKVDPCQRGVWMRDDRTLSYWEWQGEIEPAFQRLAEWTTAPFVLTEFDIRCHSGDRRFVTLDSTGLRFWSLHGPLPMVRGDTTSTVISTFHGGRLEGETLFTGGFDGVIRLWNKAGEKIQDWAGHTGQINEVRFLPEWQLFTSSAEDGTSRLWTLTGESVQLPLNDIRGASLRFGVEVFDETTLLSAGAGVLAIWTKNSDTTKLTITIPIASGERPGRDAMKRLPGTPRILVRLLKSGTWRGLIVQPDGSAQTSERGLPTLERLKWLVWSSDATRLALLGSGSDQAPRIYRYGSEGWIEEPSRIQGFKRFTFAPDGLSFAAVDDSGQLSLGSLVNGQWQVTHKQSMPSRDEMETGLHWTMDGSQITYAQSGRVFMWNRKLEIEHQFQAFPVIENLTSFGLSQDPNVLAVGSGPWVRRLDLDLDHLQTQLCKWLDVYLEGPDAPPEISALCK
ncbi:MAG TPA: WD40 repeat domain-containing protein [Oligoflexus sp.]|uniref:WD40 repeat domain-containing protein n=1 Tax=Oligoflexus sp. TaxID=1971216 RepID=UPI002D4313E5|nr:WD40 repeat domain-containing protein [Oligoflexus sp.]HYX37612.1 WD40 repeat domain-containing protein [Oligoflexus sp.]